MAKEIKKVLHKLGNEISIRHETHRDQFENEALHNETIDGFKKFVPKIFEFFEFPGDPDLYVSSFLSNDPNKQFIHGDFW